MHSTEPYPVCIYNKSIGPCQPGKIKAAVWLGIVIAKCQCDT